MTRYAPSQYRSSGAWRDLADDQPDPIASTVARPLLPWQEEEVAARRLAQARGVLDRLDRATSSAALARARRVLAEVEGGD